MFYPHLDSNYDSILLNRLGRLQAVIYVGALVGTLSCPRLLPLGYAAVYGLATVTIYLSLFYIYFFLDESIVPTEVRMETEGE